VNGKRSGGKRERERESRRQGGGINEGRPTAVVVVSGSTARVSSARGSKASSSLGLPSAAPYKGG
jgi:hypothetical protein